MLQDLVALDMAVLLASVERVETTSLVIVTHHILRSEVHISILTRTNIKNLVAEELLVWSMEGIAPILLLLTQIRQELTLEVMVLVEAVEAVGILVNQVEKVLLVWYLLSGED